MALSDEPRYQILAFRTLAELECRAYEVHRTDQLVYTASHNVVSHIPDDQVFQVSEDHLA